MPEDDSTASACACCPSRPTWLEQRCDEVNATLAPLKSFVLPGGTPRGRAAARLPHGLPARGAARDRLRRRAQRRGRPLPQPPVGPAVHPRARGQRRRRAAVGAGPLPARRVLIAASVRTASISPVASATASSADTDRAEDEPLVRAGVREHRVWTRQRDQ